LVGLAAARRGSGEGWVVVDGDRSEWYPRSDMPPDAYESIVLKIHVGHHLLGFAEKPDRKKYLALPSPPKSDEMVVAAYQKLLSDAEKQEGKARKEAFDSFGPLGKYLEQYADALARMGRDEQIATVVHQLAPFWEHNSGFGILVKTAFKGGRDALAESFFLKLRDCYEDSHRGEEMALLAEIWSKRGKHEDAKNLLLDCLRKLIAESKTATGSDKRLFENWFQNQRRAMLNLFPEDGEIVLTTGGIPNSTLI
jgi:hypothetical protein